MIIRSRSIIFLFCQQMYMSIVYPYYYYSRHDLYHEKAQSLPWWEYSSSAPGCGIALAQDETDVVNFAFFPQSPHSHA
jgi:hypothetical protein